MLELDSRPHVRTIARRAECGSGHYRADAGNEEERHSVHGTLDVYVDEERNGDGEGRAHENRHAHDPTQPRGVNASPLRRRCCAVAGKEARATPAEQHGRDEREDRSRDANNYLVTSLGDGVLGQDGFLYPVRGARDVPRRR